MTSPRDLEDDSVDYWRRDERTIKLHGPEGFDGMRRAGRLAAETLDFITPHVVPGVTTGELDKLCHDFILDHKAIPAPLNYRGFPKLQGVPSAFMVDSLPVTADQVHRPKSSNRFRVEFRKLIVQPRDSLNDFQTAL